MNDLWVIGLTGAAVGGAVGWPLVRWQEGARSPMPIRMLGGLLMMGAVAAGLIGASHGQMLSPAAARPIAHVVYAGDLLFWALFTVWIRRASGLQTAKHVGAAMIVGPLLVYAAYAAPGNAPPPFLWLLPAGTAAATYGCVRWISAGAHRSTLPEHVLMTRMVIFAVALDTAQAIRTFWPHVTWLREIVPVTMTMGFLSIAALAMRRLMPPFRAADLDSRAAPPRYARSALDGASAATLLADLERGMRDEKWYCDPHLTLPSLAAKLGAKPHTVSQALNQVNRQTLNEYLATWRVAEARRLLADPASERCTIDALAESAGFASRSAFYKTFKALEGLTPTAYRTRARRH